MTTKILQYVYYYPPSFNVNSIQAISTDGYTGNIEIIYNDTVYIGDLGIGKNLIDIFITPEGYKSWYQNNYKEISNTSTYLFETLQNIYNFVSGPVTYQGKQYATDEDEQIAYYEQMQMAMIPYEANPTYSISSSAINPAKDYGLTTNNLYMLTISSTSQVSTQQSSGESTTQSSTNAQAASNLNNENAVNEAAKSISNAINAASKDAKNFIESPEGIIIIVAGSIGAALLAYMLIKK